LGAGGVPLVVDDDEALVCVDVAKVDPLRLVDSDSLAVVVVSGCEEDTELVFAVVSEIVEGLVLKAPCVSEALFEILVDGAIEELVDVEAAMLSEEVVEPILGLMLAGPLDDTAVPLDCAT